LAKQSTSWGYGKTMDEDSRSLKTLQSGEILFQVPRQISKKKTLKKMMTKKNLQKCVGIRQIGKNALNNNNNQALSH